MNITIDTFEDGEIDYVTASAKGTSAGEKMLAKLLPGKMLPDEEKPAVMTLSQAAAFINELSFDPDCQGDKRSMLRDMAKLLELLTTDKTKIQVIKEVRAVSGLGLKAAKSLTETLPAYPPRKADYIPWQGPVAIR